MQMAMPIKSWSYVLFALVHIGTSSALAANDGCPQNSAEIAADRPDVTNSSLVVPAGSLQNENGVNLTSKDGARIVDGTNSRLRLGIAPCLEVLVDLPTYFATVRGQASSGFSDVAPAVKWQISPVPGVLDLSITAGVGLPTGTTAVAGPGVQPYLQFPWSRELGDGWGISGMLTSFFIPADPTSNRSPLQSKRRSATAPICLWSMSVAMRRMAALARLSTQAVLITLRRRNRSISISLSASTAMRLPGFSESDIHFD
jgi:Putative MetA-pathway of phenol degradation